MEVSLPMLYFNTKHRCTLPPKSTVQMCVGRVTSKGLGMADLEISVVVGNRSKYRGSNKDRQGHGENGP